MARSEERKSSISPVFDPAYHLSDHRIAAIAAETAALSRIVTRLSKLLPFEAEPWCFGAELLKLGTPDESKR
jgi:hypothetical protein